MDRNVRIKASRGVLGMLSALMFTLAMSGTASALVTDTELPGCGERGADCFFSVGINGQRLGTGNFTVAENGDVELIASGEWSSPEGNSIRVENLNGNQDPILLFATSAITGDQGGLFTIAFNLPVQIAGQIFADSQIGYSLTAQTDAGAQIRPVFASGTVMQAFEVDTSVGGLRRLNKGVNAGGEFTVTGQGTAQSQTFSASNSFIGDLQYDTMVVQLGFSLSPNSAVGISGFVQQVPEPSTYLLLLSGLAFIGFVVRRRLVV